MVPLATRRGLMQLLVSHYVKKARVADGTIFEPLVRRVGASEFSRFVAEFRVWRITDEAHRALCKIAAVN